MASSIHNDLRINSSVDLATSSKNLIPQIKNWCSHLKIESEYGGMIGEMGLPTLNFISCPQANGSSAMNLEWIAHDFVIDNCQNCQFHAEVFPKNFGRKTIEWYIGHKEKLDHEKQEEDKIVNEVKSRLKEKIVDRFKSSKTTEVSILKLVDKLNKVEDRLPVVQSILESSKLKPVFFNSLALDYLSLFLKDENIAPEVSETIVNVILDETKKLSDFSRERIKDAIARGQEHNILVQLVDYLELQENEKQLLFDLLLQNYTIEDIRGYDDPFENTKPNIISYFKKFNDNSKSEFKLFIEKGLKNEASLIRKNTSYILYQLYLLDKSIAVPFLDNMILAFNYYEDEKGGADWAICQTLIKLCYTNCIEALASIEKCSAKLIPDAKVQMLKFYDAFVENDDLRESYPAETALIIEKIIEFAGKNKMSEGFETPYTVLRDLTSRYPTIFDTKFETFIGFLITVIKEKNTFNWYKENLDTKTTTFNPLLNLDVHDIMLKETRLSSKLSNVMDMVSNVLQGNQYTHFETVLKIIRNLDSKKDDDRELKLYLIVCIKSSKCSNINLVQILPDIYNWILDMDVLAIRMEALKLLAVLVKENFEILPQTLIDLLQLLINDSEVIIKKYAIDAYAEILVKRPAIVTPETVTFLMNQYESKYIGIHEAISGLTMKLFNILSSDDQKILYGKVVVLLHTHSNQKEKRQDICEKLLRHAILLNREVNGEKADSYERSLIMNYLLHDCAGDDFYKSEKAIKLLTEYRRKNESLNDLWLTASLNFIYKYPPHKHEVAISNSFRKDYYREMYRLRRSDVLKEVEGMINYIKERLEYIDHYDYDVINIINLLGYFSLHNEVLQLHEIITQAVDEFPSRRFLFRVLNDHKTLSGLMEANLDNA